jgi:uncharacterized protein YkwD
MRNGNCFAHQCYGEPALERRLRRVRYITNRLKVWTYAENIAYGGRWRGTPRALVDAWMDSPGHRANILNPALRHVGIGFRRGSPTGTIRTSGLYTADFGFRRR